MSVVYSIAMVVVPLVPIFLLSRLLIFSCRQFTGPVAAILAGNGVAFAAMVTLGAIALSVDGSPHWSRAVSLFSVYILVVLIDLGRFLLRTLKSEEVDLMLPVSEYQRGVPMARNRKKLRP